MSATAALTPITIIILFLMLLPPLPGPLAVALPASFTGRR
jgi:hypothetical protein